LSFIARDIKTLKKAAILLILIVLGFTGLSQAAQRVFYSIHFASFRNLENANRQVNSLKEKGKMVFWDKFDVPGKGQFYRVYLGRFSKREDAVAFWEKLNALGAVSYFGVHRFEETMEPEKEAKDRESAVKRTTPLAAAKIRFVDNLDGTITDTHTKLMWIKNGWRLDFLSAATWVDAQKLCKNFNLGGYGDWRLPSIEEWKTLIDTNYENPALVEPNPFENIIGHMPYWTQTEYTYGHDYAPSKASPLESYTVMLYSGSINHQKKTERAFVLPVRSTF
jgi:hypothetical protein